MHINAKFLSIVPASHGYIVYMYICSILSTGTGVKGGLRRKNEIKIYFQSEFKEKKVFVFFYTSLRAICRLSSRWFYITQRLKIYKICTKPRVPNTYIGQAHLICFICSMDFFWLICWMRVIFWFVICSDRKLNLWLPFDEYIGLWLAD